MKKIIFILVTIISFAVNIGYNGTYLKLDNKDIFLPEKTKGGLLNAIRDYDTCKDIVFDFLVLPVKVDNVNYEIQLSTFEAHNKKYLKMKIGYMVWELSPEEVNVLRDKLTWRFKISMIATYPARWVSQISIVPNAIVQCVLGMVDFVSF